MPIRTLIQAPEACGLNQCRRIVRNFIDSFSQINMGDLELAVDVGRIGRKTSSSNK